MKKFTALLAAAAFALSTAARADTPASSLTEHFDNINQLPGWSLLNSSMPPGVGWFQGNDGIFSAQSGAANAYIAANFLGANNGSGTLDMWLLTPELHLTGPTSFSFWARSALAPGFSDNLEVRIGSGTDPATYAVLQTLGAVPGDWTLYQPTLDMTGDLRIAFHYTGAAAQSNYLGLDTVSVMPVPEPATWVLLCVGLAAILGYRHKRALVSFGAIAVSTAAFSGEPPQTQGMIAVKDPQTGQLRPPTPNEAKALQQAAASLQPVRPAKPATVKRPDGTLQRHLGDAGQTYSVLSRTPDGKLAIECVNGDKAAEQALHNEGDRHDAR